MSPHFFPVDHDDDDDAAPWQVGLGPVGAGPAECCRGRSPPLTAIQVAHDNNDTIHVQVFSSIPSFPENMVDLVQVPTPKRSLKETDVHDLTHHYTIAIVADSKEANRLIQDALAGGHISDNGEEEGSLATMMADLLAGGEKQIETVFMGIETTFKHVTPTYNHREMLEMYPVRRLGKNSVLLVDEDQPAILVTHVEYGKAYTVELHSFPPNSQVALQLIRTTVAGASASTQVLSTVLTDAEGQGNVEFTFNKASVRPGEYYIKAADLDDGSIGQSPLYTVSHEPKPRPLYGPHVWSS